VSVFESQATVYLMYLALLALLVIVAFRSGN